MEAFSDGVIAILITIMVLELRLPHGTSWHALGRVLPSFLAYALSFVFLGIYWNNHHHMLAAVSRVSGTALWANLHLLFWLSLFPFATAWMGENHFAPTPTALYGLSLLTAALAWLVLQQVIIRGQGPASPLHRALGGDLKGKLSPFLYLAGAGLAYIDTRISGLLYTAVALMWLIPDRRIEQRLKSDAEAS